MRSKNSLVSTTFFPTAISNLVELEMDALNPCNDVIYSRDCLIRVLYW